MNTKACNPQKKTVQWVTVKLRELSERMKKMDVTSFGIDHDVLLRGIYVSRKDTVGNGVLTTFDIRMKENIDKHD